MKDRVIDMTPSQIGTAGVSSRTVFTPKESLTYQNCKELECMFNDSMEKHKTEIILDFKAVSFLDSEALEVLVRIHEDLRNQGGVLKIVNIDAVCRDILKATRLINVFHVYEDMHSAVKDVP